LTQKRHWPAFNYLCPKLHSDRFQCCQLDPLGCLVLGLEGANETALSHLQAAAASNWHDTAEKARYLLDLFAATLTAQDPRGQTLIAGGTCRPRAAFSDQSYSGCSNQQKCSPTAGARQGGKGSIEKQSREEEAESRKEQEEERSSRLAVYADKAYREKCRRQEVLIVFALIGSPPGINASRKGDLVS